MSDLQPSEFGSTEGQGLWKIFQDFVANPDDIDGTAQQLGRRPRPRTESKRHRSRS